MIASDSPELQARLNEVGRTAYEVASAEKISWRVGTPIVGAGLLIAILPLLPHAQQITGDLRAEQSVPIGATLAALYLLGAAAYLRWGAHHRLHRLLEAGGANVWFWAMLLLVFLSGSVVSVFWIVALTVALGNARNVLNATADTICHLVGTVVLASSFAIAGRWADAAGSLMISACIVIAHRVLLSAEQSRLVLVAERDLLAERLKHVEVRRERERIARDLHDGIAADVSAVVMQARLTGAQTGTADEMKPVIARARTALDQLRAVIWQLQRPTQEPADFAESLKDSCEALVAPPTTFRFRSQLDDDVDMTGEAQAAVLRAAQELTRNAVRHAQASRISITLRVADQITLEVADDGVGMRNIGSTGSGFGLQNLRARAEVLGGALGILPTDKGAHMRFAVPSVATTQQTPGA